MAKARGTNSDFRIKANSSRSSFKDSMSGTTDRERANMVKRINRPALIGLNKPHMLKGQSDQIRRMLGKPVDEPLEPDKEDMLSQTSKSKLFDAKGGKLRPVRQNSANRSSKKSLYDGTPNSKSSKKQNFAAFGSSLGTPGLKKVGATMRATSQSGMGSSYGGSKVSGYDDQNNSFELEDFEDVQEKIMLDSLIEERKKEIKKKQDTFRQSFLVQFFEQNDAKYSKSREVSKERKPAKSPQKTNKQYA